MDIEYQVQYGYGYGYRYVSQNGVSMHPSPTPLFSLLKSKSNAHPANGIPKSLQFKLMKFTHHSNSRKIVTLKTNITKICAWETIIWLGCYLQVIFTTSSSNYFGIYLWFFFFFLSKILHSNFHF